MSSLELFEIPAGDGLVRGSVRSPATPSPHPAVVLCEGLSGGCDDQTSLAEALTAWLLEAGLAVVRMQPREDDPAARDSVETAVEDGMLVLDWIAAREDLDRTRIGVVGCGLGAIVASCLAGRSKRVDRLCLLAPATGEDARLRLTKPNGLPPLLDADRVSAAFLDSLGVLAPIEELARHERAALILHGAADTVVPPERARPYQRALDERGEVMATELVARADHGFTGEDARGVCRARVVGFLAPLVERPKD